MGIFGAFFGCIGVVGFNGCCSRARSGDGGFNVATLLRLLGEKVRPACSKWPKIGVLWRAGRVFSRTGSSGIPRGELRCAAALVAGPSTGRLTLQCAAKPHWRHGGQPAHAATYRVNVRVDAGVPWRYVACCGPVVARERRSQARKPPYLQGYDRGGTPKDPASRCVRCAPDHQCQKLSARASAQK